MLAAKVKINLANGLGGLLDQDIRKSHKNFMFVHSFVFGILLNKKNLQGSIKSY
jgi:hypothetical protein